VPAPTAWPSAVWNGLETTPRSRSLVLHDSSGYSISFSWQHLSQSRLVVLHLELEPKMLKKGANSMDIVSVLLSLLSLLQGMKNKRSLEEKVKDLKLALETIDEIYALLSMAKTVHDNFEQFGNAGMDPLKNSLQDKNLSNTQIKELFDEFFHRAEIFLKPYSTFNWKKSSLQGGGNLPVEITNKIKAIDDVYPEFNKGLQEVDNILKNLRESHSEENYGKSVMSNVTIVSHYIRNTTAKADRIILNTAHLLDFVHFQVKSSVNSI
jgi:hypothetical protein